MTVAEILSNDDLRQHEFPVAREKAFLAHAAVCALPRRVSEAMRDQAARAALDDQEESFPAAQFHRARDLAARLLDAQPDEIALVGPTSLALSFVAAGLPFRKGDNILVYFDDYPSNVYPWMALAQKGVEVRLLNVREYGRIRPIDVAGQIDEQTRLVALASCHFVAGWRIEVDEIGEILHDRNVLFCVDGIQTLGAFPTRGKNADFLAADAHKWLLGPCGAGIFFVRKSMQEKLRPAVHGWHNIRCPDFVAQEQMVYLPDARRYEAGTANLAGLAGLVAAMELLLEIGVEDIAVELLRKRAWLAPALQERGLTLLHPAAPEANASAILSFYRPGADMPALQRKLMSAGVHVSLRADRAGQQYIRVSPHFYNTDAELHRLLENL
ncbi:MAG TPA: aminotransferase class V-fold PLP-dependent enzyme [Candidatus Saccharimonadales bacterium]|nr:aminotransferase class V-fold PLP-dependent enzyme [Candidatus Saccharimonadales bacterium]